MKITFLSLFPTYFKPFVEESIVARAIEKNLVEVVYKNIRDYAEGKHQQVDDKVYGGGAGMLLKVEPIHKAILDNKGHIVLLSPQGTKFTQKKAHELLKYENLVLIAGRYEGFDERVKNFIDEEISIGDYVLTGGELPAMIIADAVIRLIPGVIQEESRNEDSFQNNLLDFPQYTRPREFMGLKVPEVILNGHHAKISKWRKEQQIIKTQNKRPDLVQESKKEK